MQEKSVGKGFLQGFCGPPSAWEGVTFFVWLLYGLLRAIVGYDALRPNEKVSRCKAGLPNGKTTIVCNESYEGRKP